MSDNVQAQQKSKWPLSVRLTEVCADLLRLRVLMQCGFGEMSPRRFHTEYGGATLPKIQRAFEALAQYGWLEQTRIEGDRSEPEELERFYVATGLPIFDDETFSELPDATRALVVGRVIEVLHLRSKEALKAGTMVGGREPHLSCTPILLDEQGWEGLISRVDEVFHWLIEEFDAAKKRMAESGEEPIPVTVGLLAFESPEHPAKR